MARRFSFGPFLLDTARGTLTRDGSAVAVGQCALRILQALLEAGGEPVTKAALMAQAWPGLVVEDSNLSVQVTALRKALAAAGVDGEAGIVTVPRLGYRLPGAVAVEESQLAPLDHGAVDHGGRPSIAVLPFAHLGDDPAQEYLADGVTEALIATLSRFRWFSVSGRGSSQVYKLAPKDDRTAAAELGVRYLVEGTVRKSGARLRISVQLVDAPAGACLWADRYDFADADLFDVQDAIVQQVAGAIEPALLRNVAAAARQRRGSLTAWSLVAQGTWLFHHVTRPTHHKARELFWQAARIDAELTEARLWIGRVSAGLVAYGWSDDPVRDHREGRAAALEAVQMDEQNPYAHYALAIVANYGDDFALALRSADKAIELNPSFALGAPRARHGPAVRRRRCARRGRAGTGPEAQSLRPAEFRLVHLRLARVPVRRRARARRGACDRRAEGAARVALGPARCGGRRGGTRTRGRVRRLATAMVGSATVGRRARAAVATPSDLGGPDGAAHVAGLRGAPTAPIRIRSTRFRRRDLPAG